MFHRVVITGLGCISPIGNNLNDLWKNLITGQSGVAPITHFDATEYKSQIAAEVKNFNGVEVFGSREARKMDRFSQFAVSAAQQAIDHAQLEIDDSNRDVIGVVIGTGIGGIGTLHDQMMIFTTRGPLRVSPFLVPMMLPDTGAGMIAIYLGTRGPNMAIVTACASGTNAIGEATEMVRRGQAKAILAGGSEAAIVPIAMAGMNVMNALSTRNHDPQSASRPFDLNRDGFVMGEGSAFLVLESLEHALSRSATILAEITGYGSSNDAYHISAPDENGAGAALCMRQALERAQLSKNEIDYINAHGTSTLLNDKSETKAIKTVFGEKAYKIPISSTKSMTGHLLGAAGALEALICVLALNHQMIPPTINYTNPDPDCDLDYVPNQPRSIQLKHVLSNSFGFGGHNASIIISQFSEDKI